MTKYTDKTERVKHMSIDLFKAFASVKEDKNWIKKILIGGLLMLAAALLDIGSSYLLEKSQYVWSLLLLVLVVVAGMYPLAFIFSTLHKQINSDSNAMSEWNEKNLLLSGFKAAVANLLMGIVYIVLFGVVFCLFLVSAMILQTNALLGIIMMLLSIILSFIWILLMYLLLPLSYACYGKTLKITSIVNFKKIFAIFTQNQSKVWLLFAWFILYSIIVPVAYVILVVSVVGILLIPFFTFYLWIVVMNLIAQFGRDVNIDKYFVREKFVIRSKAT